MQRSELFRLNKCQILNNKKQYLLDHSKQLENSVASLWEDNLAKKNRLQELLQKKETQLNNHCLSLDLQNYKAEEKEKLKKIDQLKKLIQEYQYLCSEAAKYSSNYSPTFPSSENHNMSNRSLTPTRSKSQKKVTTKLFCQECQRHFFPHEYYLHREQQHCDSTGYQSLRY